MHRRQQAKYSLEDNTSDYVFCSIANAKAKLESTRRNYQLGYLQHNKTIIFFSLQQIPKWWIWLYYLCPLSWSLHGLFSSQYGDIQRPILVFGETKSVASFLRDYFGFHHNLLVLVAIVLLVFPLFYAFLFGYCIGKLNFQRR